MNNVIFIRHSFKENETAIKKDLIMMGIDEKFEKYFDFESK